MSASASSRYPLQKLLKLRAHRTESARLVVIEKQRAVRECREACERIEAEISALQDERGQQRKRQMDPPAAGVPWPVALEQRAAHIEWLGECIQSARERLQKAQQALQSAEQALAEAVQAFFRAKAREDALEKRKGVWRDGIIALESRQEEDAAADLVQARHIARRQH